MFLQNSGEFDTLFEKIYKWIASSISERDSFITTLYKVCLIVYIYVKVIYHFCKLKLLITLKAILDKYIWLKTVLPLIYFQLSQKYTLSKPKFLNISTILDRKYNCFFCMQFIYANTGTPYISDGFDQESNFQANKVEVGF